MKMNLVEDFVIIGVLFSKHVRKARGIFTMKKFCALSSKVPMTSIGLLIWLNLMTSPLPRRTQPLDMMEFLVVFTDVLVALDLSSSSTPIKQSWREGTFLFVLLKVGRSLSLRHPILRSLDALRPLTLCNCDCKILTSAICRGLRWYTVRCIHTCQRCISSRQTTDNIFEIETTALAHVACAPQESGVLLTDFAAVNHYWTFSVLEHSGLLDFLCRFSRSIKRESMTHVEIAGAKRGQFLMARGVRQGCPASGFLFAMAFDPIFRWLQESIVRR